MITIRRGVPDDAAALAELAATTFHETFAIDNTPEDLALHLANSYGVAQQTAELENPAIDTLVALSGDDMVGYAQLCSGESPSCVGHTSAIELWRFYVAQSWHGRGVAQALMRAAIEAAQARSAEVLWLGVWERNPRARTFYLKMGFVDVGSKVFVVGTDEQTDRVMALPLARQSVDGANLS
jgi:ribosomal protein S18 acetylase RimI-like enzyme